MWVIAVAFGAFVWQLSFPVREVGRWNDCIGRPHSECELPSDYDEPFPCPDWQDCRTDPPGLRYLSSQLVNRSGGLWSSFAYAVIAVDEDARIVEVEIKRFYATP